MRLHKYLILKRFRISRLLVLCFLGVVFSVFGFLDRRVSVFRCQRFGQSWQFGSVFSVLLLWCLRDLGRQNHKTCCFLTNSNSRPEPYTLNSQKCSNLKPQYITLQILFEKHNCSLPHHIFCIQQTLYSLHSLNCHLLKGLPIGISPSHHLSDSGSEPEPVYGR